MNIHVNTAKIACACKVVVGCLLALALAMATACQQQVRQPAMNKSSQTPWHVQAAKTNATPRTNRQHRQTSPQTKRPPAMRSTQPTPPIMPVVESRGVVVFVNVQSRFVVADFSFNPIPAPGQRLGIYRNGQRVADAKTSSFKRESLVVADIISGEAKLDDEVRAE